MSSRRLSIASSTQPTNSLRDEQQDVNMLVDASPSMQQSVVNSSSTSKKRGRGPTINAKFAKKKAKGKNFDIQFPHPFDKVCGEHAKYFKSEVTVCVRQLAPLQVKGWKNISDEDIKTIWRFLKDSFSFSDDVYPYVMKQVQRQYRTRLYTLHKAYREKKGRPDDVSPEDWQWLIENKWNTPKFKDTSIRNISNRSKLEVGSITGTKSIVQKAYEMKDPESEEWPDAMTVWKATRLRSNGNWSVPNGEEIMNKLQEVGETHQQEISSASVPLVEHFALVLGRRSGHSRGLGAGGITSTSKERQNIRAQAEAAQKRADVLEDEVQRLTEMTKKQEEVNSQLQIELQSQRAELEAQRKTIEVQHVEMQKEIQENMQRQMATLFARFSGDGSFLKQLSSASSSVAPTNNDCD